MLSVICPIYNEEKYINKFLNSILKQDYPKEDMEILLVDGMSTDHTRSIISKYILQYPYIRLIDNPDKIVPCALNLGIEEAQGDIIMRLDAHASYQPNYFSVLVNGLKRLKSDNVGTACKTDVLNKTPKTLAIREVLSNRFGVGNSIFRTGIDKEQEVDTVPFGCWPKHVFVKYGKFDPRLVRNQDIEFNKRIKRRGGHILILPGSFCTYWARETYHELAVNNYNNGKWNILTVYYTKRISSLSVRHFIPLFFLISLIIPLMVGLVWWSTVFVSAISFVLYLGVISVVSVNLALVKHLNFFYIVITFLVLHISYGYGSLVGLLKLPFVK